MSLAELVEGILDGRRTVLLCTALGLLIAFLCVRVLRSFELEAHVLPPSARMVEPLNLVGMRFGSPEELLGDLLMKGKKSDRALIEEVPLAEWSSSDVFDQFLLHLQSPGLHRKVLEEQGAIEPISEATTTDQLSEIEDEFQRWESGFEVQRDVFGEETFGGATIRMVGRHPQQMADFVNDVCFQAEQKVLKELRDVVLSRVEQRRAEIAQLIAAERARAAKLRQDEITRLEEEVAVEAGGLQRRISILRQQQSRKREDRLARLREALAVAQAAGMVDPLPGISQQEEINSIPLFFLGTKLLEAELEALEARGPLDSDVEELRALEAELEWTQSNPQLEALRNRVHDDPYIPGLREMEAEDQVLAKLQVPADELAAMQFDLEAIPPRSPRLGASYLLTGTLLGLVAGVILALLQRVLRLQRRDLAAS